MTQLSPHFSLEEATFSETAERRKISNIPPMPVLLTMRQVAMEMEMVRSILARPIQVTSWYRSLPVNRAVGSADTSQHIKGEAVDFKCPSYGTALDICVAVITNRESIPFDQLILEHSWVHISFAILSGNPRGQVISLLDNGKYAVGLTNKRGVPYDLTKL